ncbi:Tripartite tricarboxylate transporter TctB family protein [Paracoccus sediminis]|uniref:Tripartite tricarboxylate transporter TctB family protein n=2 Tax=Paracoccus sediminis TaxID=1214787 RepID=A0A238XRS1_9RHOB|nr:Tripartite tricarboxylate transporter TctB family protein [Paracoccus sediminis]
MVIAGGIGMVMATRLIPVSPGYARVGPTLFPLIVGGALLILGVALLAEALAGRWHCEATDPEEERPDLVPLLWVGGGLLLNLMLIRPVGFILSSSLMHVMVATGFGA